MTECTKDQPVRALACTSAVMEAERLITIQVSPPGLVKSKQGEFLMDAKAARLCIEAFEQHGTDLPIDWEHASLGGSYSAPDGRAPASGWIKSLHFDPIKGLQAQVLWNPKGRETIRSGEYKYISPVVSVRKEDHRAVELHSCGLTNVPAIPASGRLAASTRFNTEKMTMPNQEDTKGGDPQSLIAEIKALLGIKAESNDVTVVLQAIRDWAEKYSKSEDKDTEVAESVRAQLGLSDDAGKNEVLLALSLREDIPARTEQFRQADERIRELCEKAVLNPNDTLQISSARGLLIDDPERFEALIGNMTALSAPPPGRTAPPPGGPGQRTRHSVIHNAIRNFGADESCKKLTTLRAFCDLRLREAGLGKLSDGEATEYEVV